jgi:hypothetical protein
MNVDEDLRDSGSPVPPRVCGREAREADGAGGT